ncbi:MAG TPA: DUF4267 domain-containing protein [Aldersonia sp.]
MKHLATGIAVLTGLFIIYIGLAYLLIPQAAAAGFGVPTWPQRDGTAFLTVKGVRDIATGLVVFALLLSGQRRGLGWAMLTLAFIPAGDMVIVLSHGGSPATAFGIHGLTAVVVLAGAALILRERPAPTTTSEAAHAAAGS